ncbi:hypothetical protein APY04_3091 [Hyphomicrobium sulfonivorans]|uniref:Uncharacterized protein n=1 Tax=Hyphomicrobium sulfonivorans TaxID=121290 RepID=A0A109B9W3_HYPSL|nr:hypothetical protein [Hyphomicrobium sulfonivorans]KWT64851.1 hypothetical protein APY04_3091 [Hyphomicrobium sulfonivorans]
MQIMTLDKLILAHASAQDVYIAAIEVSTSERQRRAAGKARDAALVALALARPNSPSEARRKRKHLDEYDLHGDDLFSQLVLAELCRAPKAVKTVSEVVGAFGGVDALCAWSGESTEAIKRWQRWDFIPHAWHWRIEQELRSRGYALSPRVFEMAGTAPKFGETAA